MTIYATQYRTKKKYKIHKYEEINTIMQFPMEKTA